MATRTQQHNAKISASLRRGRWFRCQHCTKEFWRKPSAIKKGQCRLCSRACYFAWQVGRKKSMAARKPLKAEANPNWKGGVTPANKAARGAADYKAWRASVFERDNWTCQRCGERSRKGCHVVIHAHHIKPFAVFPELRLEVDNGLTLCKKCHGSEAKGISVYLMG